MIHLLLQFTPSEMINNYLEMMIAREQLMEDIDCIVDEYLQGIDNEELNELTRILCDAVCKNFPSK